jgi:signal transduction histidine kinase/DNA-binding response OmpR family regulator
MLMVQVVFISLGIAPFGENLFVFAGLLFSLGLFFREEFLLKRSADGSSGGNDINNTNQDSSSQENVSLRLKTTIQEQQREIEQLKTENDEIHRISKVRAHLLSNLSHELRTPLTLIKGPAGELLKSGRNTAFEKNHLISIYRNSQRLKELIEQVVDLNRYNSNTMSISARSVDVCLYTRFLTNAFSSLMESKQLTLSHNIPDHAIFIFLDLDKFEKILTNLLINAAKFTSESGTIQVTLTNHDDHILITVADSGIGIEAEKLKSIFGRYETSDNDIQDFDKGLGIGLALTKEYVDLHNGTISVESAPGEGTTFTLRFMKGKEHLAHVDIKKDRYEIESTYLRAPITTHNDDAAFRSRNGYLVLVIEDDQELAQYIRNTLIDKGYQVINAENGKAGLEMAKRHVPDLILSDIMMPVMNGFELLEELRKDDELTATPTIFLSGLSDIRHRLKGLRIGVNDYIVKPFNNDELLIQIENLISFSKIRDQRQNEIEEEEEEEADSELPDNWESDEFMQRLIEWTQQRIDSGNLTTEEMADAMNVSRRTLYREVKKKTGFTVAGLLKEVRLQFARQLVEIGKVDRIGELCIRVGYENSTYFRDLYIHRFGKDPID